MIAPEVLGAEQPLLELYLNTFLDGLGRVQDKVAVQAQTLLSNADLATLAQTFSPILSTATRVAMPAHVRYEPTSDPTLAQTASMLVYIDGLAWRFTGCAGTWSCDVATAGVGTIKFTITGMFVDAEVATMPANPTVDTGQPPAFIGGICRFGRNLVRVSKVSVDSGATVVQPENPETLQGFDAALVTRRKAAGTWCSPAGNGPWASRISAPCSAPTSRATT